MNTANRHSVRRKLMAGRLDGYRILILETREEAQFSRLLAEQGADVLQCPMFTIHDAPDPAPVEAWIGRFIDHPFDDLVLTTGEGLRRLVKLARRIGREQDFIAAVGQARKFARGPKPGRALREIGLEAERHHRNADLGGHRRDAGAPSIWTAIASGCSSIPDKDHGALIGAIAAQGAERRPGAALRL